MKYVVYAGTRTAGFCFICGFRSDVGCCVVAVVESTRGVGGICSDVAFLVGGQELHVMMYTRIDGRRCHLPNQSMNKIVTFIWNMISCIR